MTAIDATVWRGISALAVATLVAVLFAFADSAHAANLYGESKMTGKYADEALAGVYRGATR